MGCVCVCVSVNGPVHFGGKHEANALEDCGAESFRTNIVQGCKRHFPSDVGGCDGMDVEDDQVNWCSRTSCISKLSCLRCCELDGAVVLGANQATEDRRHLQFPYIPNSVATPFSKALYCSLGNLVTVTPSR